MNHRTFRLPGTDGREFCCHEWRNDQARAVVQVVHGMAEHAGRYEHFAAALVRAGFAVFADDHRGHGNTAAPLETGDMGPANGLERTADDVVRLTRHARAQFPDLPVVLFGHSMGSLIAQFVLARHGGLYRAAVLSGTPSAEMLIEAKPSIDDIVAREGRHVPGETLQQAMFGPLAEALPGARTAFDWLSRDAAEVDRYIADPMCGFVLSNGSWQDIAAVAPQLVDPKVVRHVPTDLPVLILSGSEDPVHMGGQAIEALYARYREAGLSRLEKRLYPGGRHEMLNETNRAEVIADIIGWIDTALEKTV